MESDTFRIEHIQSAGPIVHYEFFHNETGALLNVELNKESSRNLQLELDETIFASIGNVKFFCDK